MQPTQPIDNSGAQVDLPVEIPAESGPLENAEATLLEDGRRLDHRLRWFAGYGALALAVIMYLAGLGAAALFLGLYLPFPAVKADMWHIVVATLAALFSVPTVLLLSVLRSTTVVRKDAETDSLHAAVGEKVMQVVDRIIDHSK